MSSRQTKNKISEFSLIKKYFAPLACEGSFNFDDDAAQIIPSKDTSLVITQDAIAEGVHFFSDDAPNLIAKKALRVNLSDLAAKGATPKYISIALGLGNSWNEEWIAGFAKGLSEDCKLYDLQLTGGDTFKAAGGFVISVTAIGEIPHDNYISRLGAKEGDAVFVTGTIGDGALGLLARQNKFPALIYDDNNYLVDRYLCPQPRVELRHALRQYATASMDISDGLIGDLEKLCKASSVGAELQIDSIPLSTATKSVIANESNWLKIALTGGDDYEILLTVPQDKIADFENSQTAMPFLVARIGTIKSRQGVKVFDRSGQVVEFERTSYDHSGE